MPTADTVETPDLPIAVGQSVLLRVGRNALAARVVEDRGHLGDRQQRVLRIRVELGDGVTSEFEVPESALEPLN
jgi:hypothetical protein